MAKSVKRRQSKNRNPRTYYAMTADNSTLYRFANHAHRLEVIRKEGLIPLGALEYREMIAGDSEGKLNLVDRRGEYAKLLAAQRAATPAANDSVATGPITGAQTQAVLETKTAEEQTILSLGQAIADALKPFVEKGQIQVTAQGVRLAPAAVAGKQH